MTNTAAISRFVRFYETLLVGATFMKLLNGVGKASMEEFTFWTAL